jgi:hypothetical protein
MMTVIRFGHQNKIMSTTPRQLQDSFTAISEEMYAACQEMATIASEKGTTWLEMRKTYETNAECDQAWAASVQGKRENYL